MKLKKNVSKYFLASLEDNTRMNEGNVAHKVAALTSYLPEYTFYTDSVI